MFLFIIIIISILFSDFNIGLNINGRFSPVLGEHFLGTDNLGRDMLSSIICGLIISLSISITVVSLSAIIGIIIGFITGYFEGALETIFLRIGDVLLAFPGFLLIIIWISVIGNGVFSMIFAITFSSWVGYARLIHGEVLKYKNKDFVLAAKSYNSSFFRISITHLIPHIKPVFLAQIPIDLSNVILIESSLNFLGLGISPKIPTLGHLVFNGQKYMFIKPSLIIFPGVTLFLLILSINFIGEGLKKGDNQNLFNL